MRRGDLVATQVMSVALTVATAAVAGLGAAALLVRQIRAMLEQRSLESAAALGSEPQDFDAIFAPVGQFFWPGVAAAVLVGVLAALYPAYRAALTDPAKVLQS